MFVCVSMVNFLMRREQKTDISILSCSFSSILLLSKNKTETQKFLRKRFVILYFVPFLCFCTSVELGDKNENKRRIKALRNTEDSIAHTNTLQKPRKKNFSNRSAAMQSKMKRDGREETNKKEFNRAKIKFIRRCIEIESQNRCHCAILCFEMKLLFWFFSLGLALVSCSRVWLIARYSFMSSYVSYGTQAIAFQCAHLSIENSSIFFFIQIVYPPNSFLWQRSFSCKISTQTQFN